MQVNSTYAIFSGFFRFDYKKVNQYTKQNFVGWKNRINQGDFDGTFKYLKSAYYDNYIQNIFPETKDISLAENLSNAFVNHITHKNFLNRYEECFCEIKGLEIAFRIEFIDLYLFPHDRGIFCIKVIPDISSANTLSDFFSFTRQLNFSFKNNSKTYSWFDFIEEFVFTGFPNAEWKSYTPQLKTYQSIDFADELSIEQQKQCLYDFGNFAPMGSAAGIGNFAPSDLYYNTQMESGLISVFKNWSALCLFDSFTRLSINSPDLFKSWEYDYFNLYVHTLYVKFFMYTTNSVLSDVTGVSSKTSKIRDEFIEFINDYHIKHISYKFLPNLLLQHINQALDIEGEVATMEVKIKRINEHFQERRESRMNKVLLTITFLSVLSVIYDFSQWFLMMGVPENYVYPYISITAGTIMIITTLVLLSRKS